MLCDCVSMIIVYIYIIFSLTPGEDAITSKSLTEEYMSIFETVWPDAYHFVRSKKKKDDRAAVAYLLDLIKVLCKIFCYLINLENNLL